MFRHVLAGGVIAGAVLLAPIAAFAATYGDLTAPNTATVGESTTFTVDPYTYPFGNVHVDGPGVATITPAASVDEVVYPTGGVLSFVVDFPVPGDYTVTVTTDDDQLVGSATVTAVAPTDDELGETGFDGAALIWFGGGAVALGAALVVTMSIVRRNSRSSTSV
jgi:hypothetical protein